MKTSKREQAITYVIELTEVELALMLATMDNGEIRTTHGEAAEQAAADLFFSMLDETLVDETAVLRKAFPA
ncbi:MAG: hypothetical protein QM729_21340 [Solirubrobacterales bacterium]